MKRLVFLFFLIFIPIVTCASIKDDSVIYCDGNYYGFDNNWYIIEKKNNKWIYNSDEKIKEPSCNKKELIEVKLQKCIDGDTVSLIINGKKERARLLAIDTPESVTPEKPVEKYGKEASDYTCKLVTNAKKIYIEYDRNSDKKDKYDRPLIYLYADDKMIQKELLKKGFAEVSYLYNEYKYAEQFKKIEKEAKEKHIGIWNDDKIEVKEDKKDNDIIDIIINFFKRIIKGIMKYAKNICYNLKEVL